jgi:hypothetical protein
MNTEEIVNLIPDKVADTFAALGINRYTAQVYIAAGLAAWSGAIIPPWYPATIILPPTTKEKQND